MARTWERTRSPGIKKEVGPRGVRYKVVYLDSTGKQRTKTLRTLKEAQVFQGDIRAKKQRRERIDPGPGRVPIREFFEHHMRTATNLRPSTRDRYRRHFRLYVEPKLGSRSLESVTKADIKTLLADMRAAGKGPATLEAVARLLHRLFAVAVEEDRIGKNPVSRVEVEKVAPREPHFLTQDEVRRIAEEVPEHYRALVSFLAWTGLRIGEASALRVKNLDLNVRTVRVIENSPEVGGRKYIGPTKTTKARTARFGVGLAGILKAHLSAYGTPLDPESFVFTSQEGGQVRQNNFRKRIFQPAAKRAGIVPVPTVHDLRHTAASLMARAGWSMRDAQEQLGHSHATMTDHYIHLFPEDREQKVAALDALLTTETA
jgi:integrase